SGRPHGGWSKKTNRRIPQSFFRTFRRRSYCNSLNGLCLNDAWRDEEDQLLVRGADAAPLKQVAQGRDVAQQRHLRNVHAVLSLDNPANHHRATVGHEDLGGGLLRDQSRVTLHGASEVRRRILHVDVQEDRVLRRDLRSNRQPQERVYISHGGRSAQLSLGHDGDAYALPYQRLDVVLRYHARARQDLQQATRFGHGEDRVDLVLAAEVQEAESAGRAGYPQVRKQRDLCQGASAWRLRTNDRVLWLEAKDSNRRSSYGAGATHGRGRVAPTQTELGTDIAGKAAGRRNYARLDLDLLRLAV